MWASSHMERCWKGLPTRLQGPFLPIRLSLPHTTPTPSLPGQRSLQKRWGCVCAFRGGGSSRSFSGKENRGRGSDWKRSGQQSGASTSKWSPGQASPVTSGRPPPVDTTRRKWADRKAAQKDGPSSNGQIQTRSEESSTETGGSSSSGRGGRASSRGGRSGGGRGAGGRGGRARDQSLSKRESRRAEKDTPQRLAKVLATAGIASRRASEDIVASGVVRVNGHVITVPQHMVLATVDDITVSGKPLPKATAKYYFALNKPKGYICTNQGSYEEGNQRLVVDLFRGWMDSEWRRRHTHVNAIPPRLFTVGRLDVPTTGLIFVTNDGEWAQKIQHPSSGLTKEYVATFAGQPTRKQMEALAAGCVVDGAFVQPKSVSPAAPDKRNKIRIVIGEGRNREVRTLAENAGLELTGLKRVRVGGYRLPNDLAIGEFREMKISSVKRVIDKGAESNPDANPMAELIV